MLSRILNAKLIPRSTDVGLVLLRAGFMILFLKHGWEKLVHADQIRPVFSDLIHIGRTPSFVIAMFSDGFCSLLILVGLATRWASLFIFCTLFVAWSLKHHFAFFGTMNDPAHWKIDSVFGEIITQILFACVALMVAGAGRYSIDARLERRDSTTSSSV